MKYIVAILFIAALLAIDIYTDQPTKDSICVRTMMGTRK